jgi:hypothetical protein
MSITRDFYLARAAEARAEAARATLANVRDRNQRAADAWQAMADRAAHTEKQRAEGEAKKAAEAARLAEAEAAVPA